MRVNGESAKEWPVGQGKTVKDPTPTLVGTFRDLYVGLPIAKVSPGIPPRVVGGVCVCTCVWVRERRYTAVK